MSTGLSFDGISSGLPTAQMINAILLAESGPLNRMQDRQILNNQKKTTLTSIRSALNSLSSSIANLNSKTLSGRLVNSSDSSIVSATATGGISGSYEIMVGQLATRARAEIGQAFSENPPAETIVGDAGDVYTIVGKDGKKTDITLTKETSLVDLNEMINAKSGDTGVASTLVQSKPGEYRLVLQATETGLDKNGGGTIGMYSNNTDNALKLGTSDTTATTAGVTSVGAQNALFSVNGVAIERATNTVSDAIDGVTFTLNKAEAGKTVTLSVSQDTDAVIKAFQDVIEKYNSAYKTFKSATASGGTLGNDATMRQIFSQLRSSISGIVEGSGGELVGSAAILGFTTAKDGTISLDTKKLEEALKTNPDMVGKVFDKMSNDTKSYIEKITTFGGGTISNLIDSIDTANSNLNKQIDNMQARLDRRKETLTAQFARLESVIGKLQSAGQSLGGIAY